MNEQVIIYKENYELISSLLAKKEKYEFFEGLFDYMFKGIKPIFKNKFQKIMFNFMVNESLRNKKKIKKRAKNYDKNCIR